VKISVLINNYNYGRYLDRAVTSVLAQTRAADEIIIVDDGSTDDSLAVARRWAERDARVRIIASENGGQLSAFNAGFTAATGDILTFLDADDEYLPGWLARLADVYRKLPDIDFAFCLREVVQGEQKYTDAASADDDFDYGLTFFRTLLAQEWIGNSTSTLSARRSLLAKYLPSSFEPDYHVNADQILVLGASLMLGRKFQINEPMVRYHVHGQNLWWHSANEVANHMQMKHRQRQLIGKLVPTFDSSDLVWGNLSRLILDEFKTIPAPRGSDARRYSRWIRRFGGRGWCWHQLRVWVRYWELLTHNQQVTGQGG